MARYQYQCKEHGDFEVERPITDVTPTTEPCPRCHKPCDLVLSVPTVVFKGEGWTPKHYNKPSGKKA